MVIWPNPKVVRSIDPDLDGEAIRVISIMPKWKPGMQKGQPVRVKYTVPSLSSSDGKIKSNEARKNLSEDRHCFSRKSIADP